MGSSSSSVSRRTALKMKGDSLKEPEGDVPLVHTGASYPDSPGGLQQPGRGPRPEGVRARGWNWANLLHARVCDQEISLQFYFAASAILSCETADAAGRLRWYFRSWDKFCLFEIIRAILSIRTRWSQSQIICFRFHTQIQVKEMQRLHWLLHTPYGSLRVDQWSFSGKFDACRTSSFVQ